MGGGKAHAQAGITDTNLAARAIGAPSNGAASDPEVNARVHDAVCFPSEAAVLTAGVETWSWRAAQDKTANSYVIEIRL